MPETNIKAALISLHNGIKNSDGPAISQALSELENLLGLHRASLHPQLVHFLEGRSYAKALAYLGEGMNSPPSLRHPPVVAGGTHER